MEKSSANLNIVNSDGVLRCQCRLIDICDNQLYPIIVDRSHPLTNLLVIDESCISQWLVIDANNRVYHNGLLLMNNRVYHNGLLLMNRVYHNGLLLMPIIVYTTMGCY